jgi:hypothetical protein
VRLACGQPQFAKRRLTLFEVNGDGVNDLLLQIAKVRSLRRDAARPIRIVPPCHKAPGRFVALYMNCNFLHGSDIDYSTSPIEHVIL